MIIKINDERRYEQSTLYTSYLEENNTTTLEFEFPEYLEKYNKKANFELKDGTKVCKLFNEITSNKLTLTRDLLKFNKLQMAIEFFDTDENLIYRTSILTIIISDSIICDDDVSEDEPKVVILNELIQKVTELDTQVTENEGTRAENETKRETSENVRISNENTRISNENKRIEEENKRISAESTRVSNEEKRVESENLRISQEETRQQNETQRIANEEIRQENAEAILKILPKTETEVLEEIDIDDAGESSFNKLSVFSNSRQESTEGYNLFDYLNNIRNTSGNNITVEKDDKMGYITVNGTPNVNYANIVEGLNITDLLEDKQTYTLKQENANNLSINYIYSQIIVDNKETLQKQYIDTRTTFNQTFTVDKTTYNYYANIQTGTIENTGTLNNFKTRFMIYKGKDDKPFELYTGGNPSPNSDYPQEIESIKDSITFKRIGENIYNFYNKIFNGEINGIKTHKNNDGSITFIGTPRMSYIYLSVVEDISNLLEDGETYTILQTSYENIYIEIQLKNRVDSTIVKYITTKDTKQSFLVDKSKYIYEIHVQYGVLPEEGENINTTLKFYLIKGEDDNYTLPVQQEMLALVEGQEDCFINKNGQWYERHYSFVGELTGDEIYSINGGRFALFNTDKYGFPPAVYNVNTKQLCNYFIFNTGWLVKDKYFMVSGLAIYFPMFLDTLEEMKAFVKEKYNEGNPFKLAFMRSSKGNNNPTYLDLQCTEEQTAVLNQLEQFSLSKGVNHIFSDDEISPKFQLKYYQDMNILLDKINKNIADVSAQII